MNADFKISIITPNYNYAHYIEETIESVINQSYPNIEFIIVDDGSTDDSVNIIGRFADTYPDKITLIKQTNKGQTAAINIGLKSVTGDIIGWINSDDNYCEGAFLKVMDVFNSDPDIEAVFGDINIIDERNQFIKKVKYLPFDYSSGVFNGFGKIISSNAIFWRKKLSEETALLNESLKYAMDSEYWSRLLYKRKIKHINQTIANFRWHNKAKTRERLHNNEQNLIASKEDKIVFSESYRNLKISGLIGRKGVLPLKLFYKIKRHILKTILGHYNFTYFFKR
jgi:glycosyltransferase involved in cell wall biosynthesis